MKKNTFTQQIEESATFFVSSVPTDNKFELKNDLIQGLKGEKTAERGYYNRFMSYITHGINAYSNRFGSFVTKNDILSLLQGTYLNVKEANEISDEEVKTMLWNIDNRTIKGIRESGKRYDFFDTYSELLTTGDFEDIDASTLEDPIKVQVLVNTMVLAVEKGIPLSVLNKEEVKVTENVAVLTKVSK